MFLVLKKRAKPSTKLRTYKSPTAPKGQTRFSIGPNPLGQLEENPRPFTRLTSPPRRSTSLLLGHVLPSSPSRVHVLRGHRVTTASRFRRRSKHLICRPPRNSKAPSIFSSTIFGSLKTGENQSPRRDLIQHRSPQTPKKKRRMHRHSFRRRTSLSSDEPQTTES